MSVHIHHAGIAVPDLEQAIEFYCTVFGYTVLQQIDWDSANVDWPEKVIGVSASVVHGVQLQGANGFLELFEWVHPNPSGHPLQPYNFGITHLAFQVVDIMSVYQQFLAAGGTAHGKPSPVGKAIAIYGRDPFGNIIELLEIVKDDAPFDLNKL
ncbi:MAG: VOC family protein [Chloroflexota bacterium]